jgi:predicted dehydrogenase
MSPAPASSPPSRREFLKRLAVFAGSSAVVAQLPWWAPLRAAPPGGSAADRVRLAVVGTGTRGRALLSHLLLTPGVGIAALCDDYAPHLQRAVDLVVKGTGTKPATFTDHRQLLDRPDIDGIIIATPLHQHAHICLDGFAAGKHVFCEKSLAYTIEECQAIADAHRAAGRRVFQVGHQRLYSPAYLRAVELVQAGEIGPITQIRAYWHRNGNWRNPVPSPELERKLNWRLYREYSCGLTTELASHHLQVANWFLGAPPLSCVGYGSINHWKDGREVYDNVNLLYRYPNGVHLVWDSLISNRYYGWEVQMMGPKGTIEAETGRIFAEKPPPAPGIVQLVNQLERGVFETIPIGGPTWVPDLKKDTVGRWLADWRHPDDGTGIQLAAFANAIRRNEPIPQMREHACLSGVATLMGQIAMEQNREVLWPKDFRV